MLKVSNKDITKSAVQSIKQREMLNAYAADKADRDWPKLLTPFNTPTQERIVVGSIPRANLND